MVAVGRGLLKDPGWALNLNMNSSDSFPQQAQSGPEMEQRLVKSSRRNTTSLTVICIAHAVNHAHQMLLPSMSFKITSEFGIGGFTFGLLVAAFSLSYSLFQAPFGAYAERLGRKRLLSLSSLNLDFCSAFHLPKQL